MENTLRGTNSHQYAESFSLFASIIVTMWTMAGVREVIDIQKGDHIKQQVVCLICELANHQLPHTATRQLQLQRCHKMWLNNSAARRPNQTVPQ